MKQFYFKIIVFSVLLSLCTSLQAQYFEIGGICYAFYVSGDIEGDAVCVESLQNGRKYSGNVVIPQKINYGGSSYVVAMIDQSSFEECTNLKSIKIPNTVTEIRDNAFQGCSGLSEVEIPNSVLRLGTSTFENCTGLSIVEIGSGITDIPNYTFSGCVSLRNIVIPQNVITISNDAFNGCPIESITLSCPVIGKFCKGNTFLKELVMNEGVTEIENKAFEGCTSLESVSFPNSMQKIKDYAFSGCKGLTSLSFGNSSINMGTSAFQNCVSLKRLDTGSGVASIGNNAFKDCISLESVNIGEGCKKVYRAFPGCTSLRDVYIPKTVKTLTCSFDGCNVETLTLDLPKISKWFQQNNNFRNLVLGNNVVEIENGAFWGCRNMESVIIGDCVTTIGENAFVHCEGLKHITFGKSVESVGYMTVGYSDFETVTSLNLTPPHIYENATTFKEDVYKSAVLYVPSESLEKYKTAIGWKKFWNIEGINAANGIVQKKNEDKRDKTIYDLNGRILHIKTKGIYITNGKKVLIK